MNDLWERLRARDPEATGWFLGSRIGAVHHYCALVCEAELVLEAIEVALADFYEKVEHDRIDTSRLDPALIRFTRVAASERARMDTSEASAEPRGEAVFRCEITPLILAGSPKAPTGVEVLKLMRDHVASCARCQATEHRFVVAEASFMSPREAEVPADLLNAVLDRSPLGREGPEEKPSEQEPISAPKEELTAEESGFNPEVDSAEEQFREREHHSEEDAEPGEDTEPDGEPPSYFDTGDTTGREGRAHSELERQWMPDAGAAPGSTWLSKKQVVVASALAGAAVIALVIVLAGGSSGGDPSSPQERSPATSESGAQPRRPAFRPKRSTVVPLSLTGAKAIDFDPNGGNGERPGEVGNAIDGNPATTWRTEPYPAGTFGPGVGIYVALPRPRVLREVRIRTLTRGWDAEIYVASDGPPGELPSPGWKKVGSRSRMRALEAISLAVAGPSRYCLIWVKKLPPADGLVSIAEISFLAGR